MCSISLPSSCRAPCWFCSCPPTRAQRTQSVLIPPSNHHLHFPDIIHQTGTGTDRTSTGSHSQTIRFLHSILMIPEYIDHALLIANNNNNNISKAFLISHLLRLQSTPACCTQPIPASSTYPDAH